MKERDIKKYRELDLMQELDDTLALRQNDKRERDNGFI
jgi:hypothetical protein